MGGVTVDPGTERGFVSKNRRQVMPISIPEAPMVRLRKWMPGQRIAPVAAIGVALGVMSPIHAEVGGALELIKTLQPPGGSLYEGFGTAFAIGDGVAAVGAQWAGGRGFVYVFERNPADHQQWDYAATLEAPRKQSQEYFGAVVDVDGDRVLVSGPGRHRVYLFSRGYDGQWGLAHEFVAPTDRGFQRYAQIEDDLVMIQGSRFGFEPPRFSGLVLVYQQDEADRGEWRFVGEIASPAPVENGGFGAQFDIEDRRVVVMERATQTGYLFTELPSGPEHWGLGATFTRPPGTLEFDLFGGAVGLGDGIIAFGAPAALNSDYVSSGAVHVFEEDRFQQNVWRYTARLQPPSSGNDHYQNAIGSRVVVSGRVVLAGTNRYGAHLFAQGDLPGARWRHVSSITAPEHLPGQAFGDAIAIDGQHLLVGGDDVHLGGSGLIDRGEIEPETAHVYRINTLCASDLNGDNSVDTADLGLLIHDFGTDAEGADINGDGIVDTGDLGALLAEFGATGCDPSR